MQESRVYNVKRNIIWGNIGSLSWLILSVISRSVFIAYLGMEYLGVNGLFSNILGLLAFSQLGIGMAINYSLYKPIAENDREKVKSLLCLYKVAYRWIGVVITVMGIIIIPFIPKLVNSDQQFDDLYIYYCIFLFNTVTSYFVTYKYAYVTALQKEYIITNANTILNIFVQVVQIIIMIVTRNFIFYLLVQAIFELLQKIITVIYLNHKFPLLVEKDIKKLDTDTKNEIKTNVKALIIHKIGEASVNQTDNIIISVFVNTLTVGLVSNYIMVQNAVAKFVSGIFNSFTASLGNLIAKEDKEKQEAILNQYNFMGFWVYGFATVSFISLIQPLLTLWENIVGTNMLIDNLTMVLYFTSIYLGGQRLTIYNFKTAAGIFNDDKWVALVQAIINLVVSIIAVKLIGLPGVYVGTIIQRMVAIIWSPIIIYKKHFHKNSYDYFKKFLRYSISTIIGCIVNVGIINLVFKDITILSFCGMTCMTAIIPNIIFLIFHYRDEEFKQLVNRIKSR